MSEYADVLFMCMWTVPLTAKFAKGKERQQNLVTVNATTLNGVYFQYVISTLYFQHTTMRQRQGAAHMRCHEPTGALHYFRSSRNSRVQQKSTKLVVSNDRVHSFMGVLLITSSNLKTNFLMW